MHTIQLESVGHHFDSHGDRIALFDELSLTIESGKSYAIVGPSGVGKSSLLTLMAGLEQPKSGQIHFKTGNKSNSAQQLRRKSGFIFQQFHLLPELDALGNIALPLKLKGDQAAQKKAQDWLERVGLGARAQHKPAQLSGGEQQRVAIARAFVNRPAFIFADEPTGNLDQKTAEHVSDMLFDFSRSQDSTLLVVTHCHRLAKQADHVLQLANGQLQPLH